MSAVPSTFGKYFLTEKIATGGMAEIFLAKLVGPGGFEKFLIIKKIHPELSGERQFVEMFVDEAKMLVTLSHGNIVPIYELGVVDSTYFIAMEYIDGPTLESLLRALKRNETPLAPTMAAYICAEVLKGLDYAHRKGAGVIHRDMSPRNVMLSRDGGVKIVDFGIAVASAPNAGSTGTGDPTGSYPYMSPEQARGEALDGRSDIFASGILLWEMLTGRSLFQGDSDQATLKAVKAAEVPPPSEHCRGAAGVLDVICQRALEADRNERYSTAGEFLIAVNRYLYSQVETVSPEDLTRVVARNCPPTTAEFARPQTLDATEAVDTPQRSGTVPHRAGTVPHRAGTVPFRRETAPVPAPKGKGRQETVQSFATNVNFQDVLAKVPAEAATPESPPTRNNALRVLLGGALLGSAVIVYVLTGSQASDNAASDNASAPDVSDAGAIGIDAQPAVAAASDASPVARIDAAIPVPDAAPRRRTPRPRADAQRRASPGTVRVGASPWADVYLDGKRIGRAPGSFPVAPGKHRLELRYKERSKKFAVDVKSGQLTSLGVVDFHND